MKASEDITNRKDLIINRSFTAPWQKVWSAWTDAVVFRKWWGPKDYTCSHSEIDFKVGGKLFSCMKSKTGEEMWGINVFKEIEEGRKIVMSDDFADSKGNIVPPNEVMPGNWTGDMMITLEFDENNGKTDLILKHEGMPPKMHDDCKKGWQESFDKLEKAISE